MRQLLALALLACFFSSCIVQAPKYTHVEQVLELKHGMTKTEVSAALGIPPYDLKSKNDSVEILIYKYRVTERRTFPFLKRETNGIKAIGKYVDLFVTYDKEGKMLSMESCSECSETEEKTQKIDVNKVITLMTITLPAMLVFLGLRAQ